MNGRPRGRPGLPQATIDAIRLDIGQTPHKFGWQAGLARRHGITRSAMCLIVHGKRHAVRREELDGQRLPEPA